MSSKIKNVPLTQACHQRGISYQRAWRAVVSGAVVAIYQGGRWELPPDQLDALVYACTNGGGDHDDR